LENLRLFWAAALTALAVENALLARGLGIERSTMFMKSARAGILFGVVLTWLLFVSSLFAALANILLRGVSFGYLIRPGAYLLGLILVCLLTYLLAGEIMPAVKAASIRGILPVSAFNSALFGAFYLSYSQNLGFLETVGYALGAGAGYTAAILIVYFARKRLAISPVPRAFRGLPILLVYLGLVSLAIYGLIGHNLPT
jgi:electron transport complex protein RnfA